MLTSLKWHTAWLKSQYYTVNTANRTLYLKPSKKMFDDLSKCCSSSSKELTLEALQCWRIWINNQQLDDWKKNEICYSAIQPLLTKKFHALYRDVEVSEMKLNLMWLIIHKIQNFIHLEGPQHVVEKFIQSCISWLSCFEEKDSAFQNLMLKLLCNLFSKEVKVEENNEKFPSLKSEILQSKKLFCRLVNNLIDIFVIWQKTKDKTMLLNIWNHFLDQCEQCFQNIHVFIWHRIFRLTDNVCADENEPMKNKILLLHKCAVSLKSVITNSKFIDCSQFLRTPAESLLKILIELCMNCRDENIDFEIFLHCQEICYSLCNRIVGVIDDDFFILFLNKIEYIEVKPLLWGLWCGLTKHFSEQLNVISLKQFNKMEMRLFRKLRAIAANFDLDKPYLEEKSFNMIETCFSFLGINNISGKCSCRNNIVELNISNNNLDMEFNGHIVEDLWYIFDGNFNSDLISNIDCSILDFNSIGENEKLIVSESLRRYRLKKDIIFKKILTVPEYFSALVPLNLTRIKELLKIPKFEYSQRKDIQLSLYLQHNFSLMRNTFRIFKPFAVNFESRSSNNFRVPLYIKIVLETLSTQLKFSIILDKKITRIFKGKRHKIKQEKFFPLRKSIYSYGEQENVKLFSNLLKFRKKMKFLHNIEFDENLNYSGMNSETLPLIFVLFFMVICINHQYANNNEEIIIDRIKWFQEKELFLSANAECLNKGFSKCGKKNIKYELLDKVYKFWPINAHNMISNNSKNFNKFPCKINAYEEENLFIHDIMLKAKSNNKILKDNLSKSQNLELGKKNNSNTFNLSKKIQVQRVREKIVHDLRTLRGKEGNDITKYFLRKKNLNVSYSSSMCLSSNKKIVNSLKKKTKNSIEITKEEAKISIDNRKKIDSVFKDARKKMKKNDTHEEKGKILMECSSSNGKRKKSKIQPKKKPKLPEDNSIIHELRKTIKKKNINENSNKKRKNKAGKIEQIKRKQSLAHGQNETQESSCSKQDRIPKSKSCCLRQRPLQRPTKFDHSEWPFGNDRIKKKKIFKDTEFNSSITITNNIKNKNFQDVGRNISEQNRSQNINFIETSREKETDSCMSNQLSNLSNDICLLNENLHFNSNYIDLECANIHKQNSDLKYSEKKNLSAVDNEKFKQIDAEKQEELPCKLSEANENKRNNLKRKNCTNIDTLRNFSHFANDHFDIKELVNNLIDNVEKLNISQNNSDQKENLSSTINNYTLIENVKCKNPPESEQFFNISSPLDSFKSKSDSLNGDCLAKKRVGTLNDVENRKKLKIEETEEIGCVNELNSGANSNTDKAVITILREKSEKPVNNMTEDPYEFSESVDEEISEEAPKFSIQRFKSDLMYSRGSRMLALVSESPKIEHFPDSSSSTNKQPKKAPNVNKNSRASKMLALLPKLQEENILDFEHNSDEEIVLEKHKCTSDEGNSGFHSGRTYLPNNKNVSSTITGSSKPGQPLFQRKSIRFDDERNETVTYFTDSPPCQLIRKQMNTRRLERFQCSK